MKKIALLLTMSCFLQCTINAQTKQVIASAGGTGSASSGSMDWTIGETNVSTLSTMNTILTQGFHQPILQVVPVGNAENPVLTIDIFPNPIDVYLVIKLHQTDFKEFLYQLYDITGKLLETKKFEAENSILPMEDRTEGTYLLKIMKGNREIGVYRIVKN